MMGCKQLVVNKMAPGVNGGIQEVYRKQVNLSTQSQSFLSHFKCNHFISMHIIDHVINKIKLKQSCWISFKQTFKHFNSQTICICFKEEQELKIMYME